MTTVHQYLALMAGHPLPGGGSATALAAAIGVSLIEKVARREQTAGGRRVTKHLRELRRRLESFAGEDSRVFGQTLRAARAKQWGAMRRQARRATDIQRDVCRLAVEAAREAERLVRHHRGPLVADAGVGSSLLAAAAAGAALLCELNGPWLKDRRRVRRYRTTTRRLRQLAQQADHRIHEHLRTHILHGG